MAVEAAALNCFSMLGSPMALRFSHMVDCVCPWISMIMHVGQLVQSLTFCCLLLRATVFVLFTCHKTSDDDNDVENDDDCNDGVGDFSVNDGDN